MNNQNIVRASKLLKAIANEKRLKILYSVWDTELSVGEIEKKVGLSQSALSQHLAILRAEKIVKTRRKAQTIFYVLNDAKVKKILNFLSGLF